LKCENYITINKIQLAAGLSDYKGEVFIEKLLAAEMNRKSSSFYRNHVQKMPPVAAQSIRHLTFIVPQNTY
jgi:hypothetical protein